MDWREKYADKIVSAQEAISHVRSGDTIHSTMFSSLPYALLTSWAPRKTGLRTSTSTWASAAGCTGRWPRPATGT